MTDRLPHEKGFHVSWDQSHRDARALAWRLDGQGPDNGAWKAVVAITRNSSASAIWSCRVRARFSAPPRPGRPPPPEEAGMASMLPNLASTVEALFAPQPGRPGKPSAESPTSAR